MVTAPTPEDGLAGVGAAGLALRAVAATGNEAVDPWDFVPCAREHEAGRLCILPDGHAHLAATGVEAQAAALEEAADALVASGPGPNAELRYDGTSDPLMSAYIEGQHDAWQLLTARAAALRAGADGNET